MKKLAIITALLATSFVAGAQTLEFVAGKSQRIFIEKTATTENSTTFAYIEASYAGGGMVKIFREQKLWDAPIFAHIEYQSPLDGSHTAIVGPSYTIGLPVGFISLGAFYRYDFGPNLHGAQATFCYLADWRWIELYGYNHFWYNGAPCFFGEERIHFRITDHFKLGAIFDVTYFGEIALIPAVGIRYDF